ncbi:MAG TPA: phosphoglycerate kinase [Polyangia bacterium]|jgi:phosphoglycerate kinase|nr:phosphoglycerate kinase [Polyangia bacterium]
MAAKTIADLDIQGRRVFIRVDFDVPLTPAGGVSDAARIRESLPTIRHAIDRGGRVVLASHLGRPKGKPNPASSLMPVAACLVELLDCDVVLADEPVGDGAKKVVADLRDGGVAMLENLRFAAGEEANDETFARALASCVDVYINDAFATAHLAHASTAGMTRFVSAKGMGLRMEREVRFLSQLVGEVEHPFVAILGGTDLSDKMGLLESLLDRADAIFVGGELANTFLRARGGSVGTSRVEAEKLAWARAFLARAEDAHVEVRLPCDLMAASGPAALAGLVVPAMRVPDDLEALDIGPETTQRFAEGLAHARTVFWDGPMGGFNSAPFAAGTIAVAKAVAAVKFGLTVVGGPDLADALGRAGVSERITHISTGGCATLEFVEGKKLPGLAALES